MSRLTPQTKVAIWEALQKLSRHHREFPDALWTLPAAELDRLDAISEKFHPQDPVATARFLFDEALPDIGLSKRGGLDGYQVALRDKRINAMHLIVDSAGLDGVHRLVDISKDAFIVGWTLAECDVKSHFDNDVLADLESDTPRRASFSLGYARQRANAIGLEWIDKMVSKQSGRPVAQARVLLGASNDLTAIWQRVSELGREVRASYWKEFAPYGLGTDVRIMAEAARHLLDHGRPASATDLLSMYTDTSLQFSDAGLVADVLDALITTPAEQQGSVSAYELRRLLDWLRSANFDEDRLGVLEWRLLPALGPEAPAPILERRLARDPGFFVEVISMCFKRADHSEEHKGVSKEAAQNAFRLLREWQIVPGSEERSGEVDESKLTEWLGETQNLLAGVDRTDIGLLHVGQVFAHAKEDPNGTWPTLAVRNAVERLASEALERGFTTGTYNKRGVTSRGLTDGGKQEYALADRYARWADLVGDRWPRTGAALRSVADGYRSQGRAEDEEARRVIEGLDY
jgi:hypothetical protein